MKSLVLLYFLVGCTQLQALEHAIESPNNELLTLNTDFNSSSSALAQTNSALFRYDRAFTEADFIFDYRTAAFFWLFAPMILGVLILGHRYLSVADRS